MEANCRTPIVHATTGRRRPRSAAPGGSMTSSTSTSRSRRRIVPRILSLALVVSASNNLLHVCDALLPPFFTTQLWSSAASKARATLLDIAGSSPLGRVGDDGDASSSSSDIFRSPFGPSKSKKTNGVARRGDDGIGVVDAGPMEFTIERLDTNTDRDFREISEMCIGVFFDEMNNGGTADFVVNGGEESVDDSKKKKSSTPLKPMNLAYLRHLQYSDLRTRKFMGTQKNVMFIARRKIPPARASGGAVNGANGSTREKVNGSSADDYELGEVLGFVEVTARPFGLGRGDDLSDTGRAKLRPVLANLAVKKEARKSGVGSMLVDACEDAVLDWKPGYDEIILQVEEDNPRARRFYEKRGYQGLFSDPTCRRYDANGLILRQVRATKLCMRKDLKMKRLMRKGGGSSEGQNGVFGSKLFQVLKDAVSAGNR